MMPRGGRPPTATGLPARVGSAMTAAEANIASTSPKRIRRDQRIARPQNLSLKGKGQLDWFQAARMEQATIARWLGLVWWDLAPCDRPQLLERPTTDAAVMSARFDRRTLASVHTAALPAAPGKAGQCKDLLLQRMIDRDGQQAIAIHFSHLPQKVRPVIGTPLEDVILPLVNHFVRQRARDFVLAIDGLRGSSRQQRHRKPNLPMTRHVHAPALCGHAWTDGRDE